jgi:glycosyltransferase involved in cell wall biosynthesis
VSRVLHVITGLSRGGAETMLVHLASGLRARGWPQHVVSLRDRGAYAETLEAAGIPVTALGTESVAAAPAAQLRLARLVHRFKPDVLQGWMYHGNLAAAFAHRLCPGANERRLIWNLRASNMDASRYARLIRANAWLSRWPESVIANSQAGLEFHLAEGFRPRRAVVIPNGIDSRHFRPDRRARAAVRAELGIPAEAVLVLKLARVDAMKDHPTFLAAMDSLPGIRGLLVGKDTETLPLPGNVQAAGLRTDVPRFCAAADLIVSSSAFGEGFSNALAEGMSAGLIPVATDVGDARAIVGDTGTIVPPGDSRALAEAIAAQAALQPEERRRAGRRARARIEAYFAPEKAIEAFARLYTGGDGDTEVVSGRQGQPVAMRDGG